MLLKAHPRNSEQVLLRHAKDMNVRDFKTGNFIIHGGFRAQPWARLFEQPLNFNSSARRTQSLTPFRNARPQPAEQPSYSPKISAGSRPANIPYAPNRPLLPQICLERARSCSSPE